MAYQWDIWKDRWHTLLGGKKPVVGLAMGVFDFCHEGHINFLRRAAENCDRLVVGVHTDAKVRDYKGIQPSNSGLERKASVESLGFAWQVAVESDRIALCKKFRVDKIFHGDDWDRDAYIKHFGVDLMKKLGVELVMLPHTPGISSTALRAEVPPVGWWLHSSMADWNRTHIFDHMKGLFAEVGGIWFLSGAGRELAKTHFEGAPRFLLEDGMNSGEAARLISDHKLDVLITAHFNFDSIAEVLSKQENPPQLVVISHGRSGKPGTSADASHNRGETMEALSGQGRSSKRGNMTIHDWSFADDSYGHMDTFLQRGGSFANPVPETDRPQILLLPTWSHDLDDVDEVGLIMGNRWRGVFKQLALDHDLVLSPHPLLDPKVVESFVRDTGASVLPAEGKSFQAIPNAHAVVADLSGVLWEALLFDTPVILGCRTESKPWPDGLTPTREELVEVVPAVQPEGLLAAVQSAVGDRRPSQRALGEARLGPIDGQATKKTALRIEKLITKND
jgi:glycerol-3-phosphate cytidylyltransferase